MKLGRKFFALLTATIFALSFMTSIAVADEGGDALFVFPEGEAGYNDEGVDFKVAFHDGSSADQLTDDPNNIDLVKKIVVTFSGDSNFFKPEISIDTPGGWKTVYHPDEEGELDVTEGPQALVFDFTEELKGDGSGNWLSVITHLHYKNDMYLQLDSVAFLDADDEVLFAAGIIEEDPEGNDPEGNDPEGNDPEDKTPEDKTPVVEDKDSSDVKTGVLFKYPDGETGYSEDTNTTVVFHGGEGELVADASDIDLIEKIRLNFGGDSDFFKIKVIIDSGQGWDTVFDNSGVDDDGISVANGPIEITLSDKHKAANDDGNKWLKVRVELHYKNAMSLQLESIDFLGADGKSIVSAGDDVNSSPATGAISTTLFLGLGLTALGTGAVVLKKKEEK